jgi:hypothetical protein
MSDIVTAKNNTSRALALPTARQAVNLSVAVAGTVGGSVLLASNIAFIVAASITALPWIPLTANAALIFGGLMFAREYRRGRGSPPPPFGRTGHAARDR